MRRPLKTFVIPAGKAAGSPPEPGPDVELEAASDDGLLAAAHRGDRRARAPGARGVVHADRAHRLHGGRAVTTPDAVHEAEQRLQTILKAVVVGARVQDPASRPAGEDTATTTAATSARSPATPR